MTWTPSDKHGHGVCVPFAANWYLGVRHDAHSDSRRWVTHSDGARNCDQQAERSLFPQCHRYREERKKRASILVKLDHAFRPSGS